MSSAQLAQEHALPCPPPNPLLSSRHWKSEREALYQLAHTDLSPSERLVFHVIRVHIADHADGWPSQPTLARLTGLAVRHVRRIVGALMERGFLRARFVDPGGLLPNGALTPSGRNVYCLGPSARPATAETGPSSPSPPRLLKTSGQAVRRPPDTPSATKISNATTKKYPLTPPATLSRTTPMEAMIKRPPKSKTNLVATRPPDGEVSLVCQAWDALGLGVTNDLARIALANRKAEGATLELLEAAVVGASLDPWLRSRAKVPFAVVFADLPSVRRFAHEGRKVAQNAPAPRAPPSKPVRSLPRPGEPFSTPGRGTSPETGTGGKEAPPPAIRSRRALALTAHAAPCLGPPSRNDELAEASARAQVDFAARRAEALAAFARWGQDQGLLL